MKVVIGQDYLGICMAFANTIIEIVESKPDATLGLATGSSPMGVYKMLVEAYQKNRVDFSYVHTINLDEYIGLNPDHSHSYHYYMNYHLFRHINIPIENTYVPGGTNGEGELLCLQEKLIKNPIDCQLLGSGGNGHIGFNEPNSEFILEPHLVRLSESTIQANARFFDHINDVPKYAITMGTGDIMRSKKLLVIAGPDKYEIVNILLNTKIVSPQIPCTVLHLHPDAILYIDQMTANKAGLVAQLREWPEKQ